MSNFYTWPAPAFPFRLYFDDPKCRVFIIHNLSHNYDWLREVRDKIKSTDYFFVTLAWYLDDHLANHGIEMINELQLDPSRFFVMYNDLDEKINGSRVGLVGDIINHNAFLDENAFYIESGLEKKYDAVYIARRSEMKRHYLAKSIESLALVAGGINHKNKTCDIPKAKNDPSKKLDSGGIRNIINQSRTGLCLSAKEGACWSSGEYLLCGTPVVSTHSQGGRSAFYNVGNSIIASDDAESINLAVKRAISREMSPKKIREDFIRKQLYFRALFKHEFNRVLNSRGVSIDVDRYFSDHFMNQMYKSQHFNDVVKTFLSVND